MAFMSFSRDNIRKIFTVMHYQVLEPPDTLSFALLACIILYINGKQFRGGVLPFVLYIYFMPIKNLGYNLTLDLMLYHS